MVNLAESGQANPHQQVQAQFPQLHFPVPVPPNARVDVQGQIDQPCSLVKRCALKVLEGLDYVVGSLAELDLMKRNIVVGVLGGGCGAAIVLLPLSATLIACIIIIAAIFMIRCGMLEQKNSQQRGNLWIHV